jgi:uncharacterized protein (TIGR04222 family)
MVDSIANAPALFSSASMGDHPIDPYRIAYLRGGAREVLNLRLFELMQMGYLIVQENRRWYGTPRRMRVAPDAPDLQKLPAPDRVLLDYFRTPRSEAQIRRMPMPPELLMACSSYQQELRRGGLLSGLISHGAFSSKFARPWLAALFVFILFMHAYTSQSFSLFLIAVACALVLGLVVPRLFYRPTSKGRQYLARLSAQYAPYAHFDHETWALTPPAKQAIILSIFGFGVLAESPADALGRMVDPEKLIARQRDNGNAEGHSGSGFAGCGGCGGCGG